MARRRSTPQPTAKVAAFPAPIGGWNARDPLQVMKPSDAITLDNWYLDMSGELRTRGGYTKFATGLPAAVETLISFAPPSGITRLFAACGGGIYDISAGGVAPAASVTGLTTSRLETTTITVLGGTFLVVATGFDTPRTYNGSTWASYTTTSSVTLTTLTSPAVMVNRLWWIQRGTLDAYYGDTAAIGGALTKFPMGALFSGGELIAHAAWTRDGGSGPEDYTCFISSRGEVLIYSGTDPTSASTWTKVGMFRIAEPVGRKCVMKAGADLAILTTQGVVLLGQVLDSNVSGQSSIAVTNKVLSAFASAAVNGSKFHGWQMVEVPAQGLVFVNVPVTEGKTWHQYVLTANKGSWARFRDLNAPCWAVHGGTAYFGSIVDTVTGKASVMMYSPLTESDDGKKIDCFLQTGFSDFGSGLIKQFLMARANMKGPAGIAPNLAMRLDYDTTPPLVQSITVDAANGVPSWESWNWDVEYWGYVRIPSAHWDVVTGLGQRASLAFRVSTDVTLSFFGIDLTYQVGGIL